MTASAASPFLSTPSGWRATRRACAGRALPRHFYPRPPGGGRPEAPAALQRGDRHFYPRPPGGGRRWQRRPAGSGSRISIHALRVEGDLLRHARRFKTAYFYPRPPGGGRLAKTDKVFICFCAKGRRICLFKTRKEKICRWRFKKDKFWVLIWCEGSGKSVCALASHCG